MVRELRRPEQVRAPSHLAKLGRMTCAVGHPEDTYNGRKYPVSLWAGADDTSGPVDGRLLRTPGKFAVGHTGDQVDLEEVEGHLLPVGWVDVTDEDAARMVEAGYDQTSLDYGVLLVKAADGATWTDPATGREHAYDVEHVLDEADPRMRAAIAAGVISSYDEIGPNHFAVAIRRGVGGSMSAIRRSDGWRTLIGDLVPASGEARVDAAALSAEAYPDAGDYVGEHPCTSAPVRRYGRPAGGWLGWSEAADGTWIAFWEATPWLTGQTATSPGLLWTARAPDGSVVGSPSRVRRPQVEPQPESSVAVAMADAAGLVALRTDLGDHRPFSMVREADETGTSGTGRVLDGVVWADGAVTVRWRSEAPGETSFASWSDMHRVHACSHPGNGTRFAFPDGLDSPACSGCSDSAPREREVLGYTRDGSPIRLAASDSEGESPSLAPVLKFTIPGNLLSALPGAKATKRADSDLHDVEVADAAPLVEALSAMSKRADEAAAKVADLDRDLGAAKAALKIKSDELAALAPVAEREAKRVLADAVTDAKRVAPGAKLDEAKSVGEARRIAVVSRLGDAVAKDMSDDAVAGAYAALAKAGVPSSTVRIPDPVPPQVGDSPTRANRGDASPYQGADKLSIASLG